MHTKGKLHNHDETIHIQYEENGKVLEHTCIANINEALSKEDRNYFAIRICKRYNNFDDLLDACKLGLNAMCYISDTDDKIDKEKQEEKIAFVKRIIANAEIT